MAAVIGSVAPFDNATQSWEEYSELLDCFFEANDIKEPERRKAVLLSGVGATTYSLLRNLVSPELPKAKTYEQLTAELKKHFNPTPSEIVQRFKFNSRIRKSGESIAEYVAELRKLALHCDYKDALSEMLRDRLVCGVNDDRMQRRLLSETKLTFDKALELCQAIESASKDVKEMQGKLAEDTALHARVPKTQVGVHKVSADKTQRKFPSCYRCKGQHSAAECKFATELCHNCGKRGHIKKACRSKAGNSHVQKATFKGQKGESRGPGKEQRANQLRGEEGSDTEDMSFHTIYSMSEELTKVAPITRTMNVNGKKVTFEVDTGCGITILSKQQYTQLWKETDTAELKPCSLKLKTYTGEKLGVLGMAQVKVQHGNKEKNLPVVVVGGKGPNLLGRSWLQELAMMDQLVTQVKSQPKLQLEGILERHAEVFKEGLGQLKGVTAKITVDREAQPRFCKPRPVPYAVKPLVESELQRLLDDKIIEPVQVAEWAAPIVPVRKPDGSIRICGDYKLTVNRASRVDQYPIPKVEDLFAQLNGGQHFTKLDMSHAYQQVVLEEESRKYVTINTHKGLYTYTRLPFGAASSPAIFQRTMEGILGGIPNVAIYLDDILCTGPNEQEHLKTLEEVLQRLEKSGLRLKRGKCEFMGKEVTFLGHKINASGLHPLTEKVEAIAEAPEPQNVSELKAYLGLLNYYHRFLPKLSTLLAPLHTLLKKEEKWSWGVKQQKAFEESKVLLQSCRVLVHYDSNKPLILACDASPYGVGAVLSHRMADGSERPIGFVSRTLSGAEKNYSQLDKEGLAVVFGVTKFHKYLYGRQFAIVTDHKPLISLFSEMRAIPQMTSPRIQRWAVTLAAYEYTIMYKVGRDHTNADALSRLPLDGEGESTPEEEERVLLFEDIGVPLVNAQQIKKWTDKDPVLARVREYILRGWPKVNSPEFIPYARRQDELSTKEGCILWGGRVVVPQLGRNALLKQLHQAHPGITRMKGLARSYMWWPNIDAEVEALVKACATCQETRNSPPVAPLHPWEVPDKPWRRIHIDYAGPWMGRMCLILVDAYSKWIDAYSVSNSTSAVTIECLRRSFSQHGIPEIIVSDNGTCFTSEQFQEFAEKNGIRHITTAPYHPSSNGLAERAVQTFKSLMKKMAGDSIETKMSRALFSYRIIPQSTTGKSPAELLSGRKLRSTLDLIDPDFRNRVHDKQEKQKGYHDMHARVRILGEGDLVYTRNFGSGPTWVSGVITEKTGPVSFQVTLGNGQVVRRHIDQVRGRNSTPPAMTTEVLPDSSPEEDIAEPPLQVVPEVAISTDSTDSTAAEATGEQPESSPVVDSPAVRRSQRTRKAPDYLKDYT
ncbi:uncharacterized protein K02A2.6-like [Pygocentrus nattereri]|uniref:uncharacterized protein K02A2.6-like n=1 Tax=Pygocentrus nattereri TaxID=42514 RepID=UPI0018918A59|nr:uncharacterized protein K02A2.6-like [Pygocentrus nattereri]